MKKLKHIILVLALACAIAGCESSNQIIAAHISNITSAGSSDYSLQVIFDSDTRIEQKYYDIQVKSSVENLDFTFFRQGEGKFSANIAQKDRWNSLTSIIYSSLGQPDRQTFSQLKDAQNAIYVFNVSQPTTLIFRVVAGECENDADGGGQILANTQQISEEFVLKCG